MIGHQALELLAGVLAAAIGVMHERVGLSPPPDCHHQSIGDELRGHGCVHRPADNAYIEAFNSRLRQECLNASWFLSMADARARIEDWRTDYNHNRPHSSLSGLTPAEFADQLNPARKVA